MIRFIDKAFVGGQLYTAGMVADLGIVLEKQLVDIGDAVNMAVTRPILQTGVKNHSDVAGTWAQSGNIITLAITAHGAAPGDTWAFNPIAGTGTIAIGGIYVVQSTPDANTITLQSNSSGTGTGTMAGTGAQVVYSGTIPGGSMGKNGSLRIMMRHRHTSSANNKTFEVFFGGSRFTQWVLTTSLTSGMMAWIQNLNSEQVQQQPNTQGAGYALGAGSFNTAGSGDWTTTSIDTTTDQLLQVKITKATGSELARVDNLLIELIPTI